MVSFFIRNRYIMLFGVFIFVFFNKLLLNPGYVFAPGYDLVGQDMFHENVLPNGLGENGELSLWNNYHFCMSLVWSLGISDWAIDMLHNHGVVKNLELEK